MYIFVFNHNLGNINVKKNGYHHYMIWKCTSKKVVAVCVKRKIFLDKCQQLIRIRPLSIWKAKFLNTCNVHQRFQLNIALKFLFEKSQPSQKM